MRAFIIGAISWAVFSSAASEATYTVELDGRTYTLEEVYFEGFSKDLEDWVPEGDAKVTVSGGWLEVDARFGEQGAVTIWCRKEFSGPQLVEYDVRLLDDSRYSNVNMFLMASMPDGPGILETSDSRNGSYGQYHQFPNYLVTLLNSLGPERRDMLRLRMRLDPGFNLVSEGWYEPFVFGKVHHVAYLIQPPEITVFLDGRKLGRAEFEKKYESGLHGLRIWHTHSIYDNFRVSRIVGKK